MSEIRLYPSEDGMQRVSGADEEGCGVHDRDAGGEPAEVGGRERGRPRAFGVFEQKLRDLVDDLQDGARADGQEYGRGQGRVGEAGYPGPQDGGAAPDQGEPEEVPQARTLLEDGGRDADTFRDVVEGEPDDEEDAESDLAERERRPDGQALAEVVQPDTPGYAVRGREPAGLAAAEETPAPEQREKDEQRHGEDQRYPGEEAGEGSGDLHGVEQGVDALLDFVAGFGIEEYF